MVPWGDISFRATLPIALPGHHLISQLRDDPSRRVEKNIESGDTLSGILSPLRANLSISQRAGTFFGRTIGCRGLEVDMGADSSQTDEELLRQFDVDPMAFRIVFERYHAKIISYCMRLLSNESMAVDCAQETFFAVWRSRNQFDENTGTFPRWLYGIARNQTLAYVRIASRRPEDKFSDGDGSHVPDHSPDAADYLIGYERSSLVFREIDALGVEYRVTFLLHLFGLKHEDIADIVGCNIGTVPTRVFKARARLAESLGIAN